MITNYSISWADLRRERRRIMLWRLAWLALALLGLYLVWLGLTLVGIVTVDVGENWVGIGILDHFSLAVTVY